jgi:sugar phosphate isomerase/epimerase
VRERGVGVAASQPGAMFVSLPPWAVARNVGWPEQARLAARVGYKGIDWAFGPAKAAGCRGHRALLAELGIVPTIVNLPMNGTLGPDDAAFEAQLPALARTPHSLGDRVQPLPARARSRRRSTASRRRSGGTQVQRRLSAVATVLAKEDMRLGLEFLGPLVFRAPPRVPFVWTLRETLALCEASGPNVGVTLDAWHWYHSGSTVADIRAANASRIVHVHVSTRARCPPSRVRDDMRLLPGEGVIDLVGFFVR